LDEDTNPLEQLPNAAGSAAKPVSASDDSEKDDDSDYVESDEEQEEDEVMDMVVKSRQTLMREKYDRALATGNVHSVLTTTTSDRSSSMRSTFQSISSTVTAMRHGSKLQERKVTISQDSPMIKFEATRMILDPNHEKISVAPREIIGGRKVKVSVHPFSQGGLRNVYRMEQSSGLKKVAKESRHAVKYQERLKFHFETAKCQARARTYAKKFNKSLTKCNITENYIRYLTAEVYRLKDAKYPGGFRYLAVEDELKGDDFQKWNSNNGYVNNDDSMQCHVAQAFR